MKIIERIWRDIKRGESIDLYATILLAFILVVLSILNLVSPDLVAALTLSVLGLLAISNLVNRHRVDELISKVAGSKTDFFLDEFPSDFRDNLQAASEVWIVGVTLRGIVKNYYGLMEQKLRQGHQLRVLLVHPEGSAVETAVDRIYAPSSRNTAKKGLDIRDDLQALCELRLIAPGNLDLRTIQNPMTFGAVCLNASTAIGTLYLEHLPFRTVAGTIPKFVLRAADGKWFDLFKAEIQTLWDNAVEWNCE